MLVMMSGDGTIYNISDNACHDAKALLLLITTL
jgi:hypothetical protein